jgi:hypothetical protein
VEIYLVASWMVKEQWSSSKRFLVYFVSYHNLSCLLTILTLTILTTLILS